MSLMSMNSYKGTKQGSFSCTDMETVSQKNFYTTASLSTTSSIYNGKCKLFPMPPSPRAVKRNKSPKRSAAPLWDFDPFVYRVNDGQGVGPLNPMTILHEVFHERGWKEFGSEELRVFKGNLMGWNICWRTNFTNPMTPRSMFTWQFTNSIPRAIGFCNKDYLSRYVQCMREVYGSIFDFSPISFSVPQFLWMLEVEHDGRCGKLNDGKDYISRARNLLPVSPPPTEDQVGDGNANVIKHAPVWISKPVGKSQGRGIQVFSEIKDMEDKETPSVVQEYILRPLLIAGHKFDLRIYVVVASAFPLSIYVYQEGLTRFATEKYDITNLNNVYSHLTNVSINKLNPEYEKDKDLIGQGCKWDFRRLRQYLKEQNCDDWYMWQRITSIIVLSLIGEANRGGYVPYTKNCFEFLGYDILLDADLRPWLLEVNHCPGLNGDCDVDFKVKNPMLHDLFNLLGLPCLAPGKPETARCSTAGRPETARSVVTPPEFMRTVNPIMLMEQCFNKHRETQAFQYRPGQNLRNRMMDTTAIYTQDLAKCSRPITADSSKPKKKKPTRPNKRIDETVSSKDRRPYKPRDWTKPIKQCGGWVRVFPFDEMTTEQCKGRLGFDVQLIVNRVYQCLKNARDIAADRPGHTDDFYSTAYKSVAKLTTEVWLPPVAPPTEKWESRILIPPPPASPVSVYKQPCISQYYEPK